MSGSCFYNQILNVELFFNAQHFELDYSFLLIYFIRYVKQKDTVGITVKNNSFMFILNLPVHAMYSSRPMH